MTSMKKEGLRTTSPYSWQEFERFTDEILNLGGFERKTNVKLQGRQTDIWCTASNSLLSARVIVECKSTKGGSSLPLHYVTEFCSRVALARASGEAELGWLITNHSIPDNAWSVIKDAHLEGACNILNPQELLSKLLDTPRYISQLGLSLPKQVTGYVDPHLEIFTGIGKYYASKATFTDLFDVWLQDSGRPLLLLLGDYGQGKTTCCEQIIRRYRADSDFLRGRIPLFIRLRDVANQGYNLSSMLRVCLHEQFGLNYHSFELIDYLLRKGLFLCIFDGLDEITYTLRWAEIFEAFKQIAKVVYQGNKVIVTSRPGVFPPKVNIIDSLERLAKLLPDIPNPNFPRSNYVVAYLKYFDERQIRQAISNFGISNVDETVEIMERIHDLTDLSKRPITLRMILESLDLLKSDAIHGHADLYDLYTSTWLSRDGWRSNIESISIEQGRDLKREFLEELAWYMYSNNESQLESSFIDEVIKKRCIDLEVAVDLVHAFSREIAVCSFLDTRKDGTLSFSHKSFYEYYLAKHLSSLSTEELVHALSNYVFNYEVLAFLTQLIAWKSFIESEVGIKPEEDRTLATNIIQANSIANLPLLGIVRLLKESIIRCNSNAPISVSIHDSEIRFMEMTSSSFLDITWDSCAVTQLKAGSPHKVQMSLKKTAVNNVEISATHSLILTLKDSSLINGVVKKYKKCDLIITGEVSLSGLIFDSFGDLTIKHNGISVPKDDNVNLMKALGARSITEYQNKQERKNKKPRPED